MRNAIASRNVVTMRISEHCQFSGYRRTVINSHLPLLQTGLYGASLGTRLLPLACLKNMMSFA